MDDSMSELNLSGIGGGFSPNQDLRTPINPHYF